MNLQEQIGALDSGVDQLVRTVEALASRAAHHETQHADAHTSQHATESAEVAHGAAGQASAANASASADQAAHARAETAAPAQQDAVASEPPALKIARPAQNTITMTIGEQTVSLNTQQIGQLIEELANARASMTPEPPPDIPQGWRFVSTKNPVMAVQKQSNGDRLLVLRHTGHGWVPFTFSPDIAIQLNLLMTQR